MWRRSVILVVLISVCAASESLTQSRVERDANPESEFSGRASSKSPEFKPSRKEPRPVYKSPKQTTTQPPNHKLIVGNWIAQWDTKYKAWFYYNINTEQSTWVKPADLAHVVFKHPDSNDEPLKNTIDTRYFDHGRPYSKPLKQAYSAEADRRILVESATDEFFGLNTTVFKTQGIAAGIWNEMVDYWEASGKSYIAGLYSSAKSSYWDGFVDLIGWWLMESLTVLTYEMMRGINSGWGSGRSFDEHLTFSDMFTARTITEEDGKESYSLPIFDDILGIKMRIPIDESLQGCYKERESCVNKDFPAEVDHLIQNIVEFRDLFWGWLQIGEKIKGLVDAKKNSEDHEVNNH